MAFFCLFAFFYSSEHMATTSPPFAFRRSWPWIQCNASRSQKCDWPFILALFFRATHEARSERGTTRSPGTHHFTYRIKRCLLHVGQGIRALGFGIFFDCFTFFFNLRRGRFFGHNDFFWFLFLLFRNFLLLFLWSLRLQWKNRNMSCNLQTT